MSWQRDEYRDRTTSRLVAVEVIPVNDIAQHVSNEDCACIPECKSDADGVPMLIHAAFDGRELSEAGSKEKDH